MKHLVGLIIFSFYFVLLPATEGNGEGSGEGSGEKKHSHKAHKHDSAKKHKYKHKHRHAHRHHKAHSHGVGKLNLAVEGNRLAVEMEIPGHDIVGFEHKAKTKAQKAKVKSAMDFLKVAESNLETAKAANCQAKDMAQVKNKFSQDHSEFHISYKFECASIKELTYVKILLFKRFKAIKSLKAQGITESGQFSKTLSPKSPQFGLRK